MTRRITRRRALAASAAGLGYLYTAPATAQPVGSNARLKVVGIGVGGKGSSDIDQAGNLMEVIAVCDVDQDYLGAKKKKWPQAATFTDYRRVFDDASLMRNADAFTVSTPDHNHAVPSVLAMRARKHVYTQKPLTHDVAEAHLLRAEAKKNNVCTQMGNQGTAANGLRKAVELVQAGELGAVREVHVWTNRPVWPQAPGVVARPAEAPVPAYLDWDSWLGTAPQRPYSHGTAPRDRKRGPYHDFNWRGFWDFGTGAIGDMACHTANMAFMALRLGHPTKVSAEAGDVNPETCPSWAKVKIEFPARGTMPAVNLFWYEGRKDGAKVLPPAELVTKAVALTPGKKGLVDSGSIVVGERGIAYSPDDYGAQVYFETGKQTGGNTPPERLGVNNAGDQGQKNEWVRAIREGKPELALANFDYAGLLTAAFLLGNVAIRTGKPFTWDGENCRATDLPEAAPLVRRQYRQGWDLIGYNAKS
jgi:predicted dehydrogenase